MQRGSVRELAPQGRLGSVRMPLAIGFIGSIVFLAIAYSVHHRGAAVDLDVWTLDWMRVHQGPAADAVMRAISYLGALPFVVSVALGAMLFFASARAWRAFWATLITVPGGMLLNTLVKLLFHRPRPDEVRAVVPLTEYSFPSGHTAAATLIYGLLAVFVSAHMRDPRRRFVALAVGAGTILSVALSRVYLRVHYISDVVAAIGLHAAWLTLILAVFRPPKLRPRPTE